MRVALGVCGGIAAYKAAEITRQLQERGLKVQVVMTAAAQEFVRPLTFAALTGEKVITDLWRSGSEEPNVDSAIEHIGVAQSIDLLLISPATADTLAKLAHGLADDFLSTLALATKAPVVVAPAMNVNMWEHPATQVNLNLLRERGVRIVDPDSGYLACGMVGAGRLAANEAIVSAVVETLHGRHDLSGETILVTAGPTREPIDPVRYLGNRSSGKMGYALADAAARRGAQVILVTGPVSLRPPVGVETIRVTTAAEMRTAVLEHLPRASMVIKAAAVADYRVRDVSAEKLKRNGTRTVELEPTEDILAEVGARRTADQVVIGFAAETQDTLHNAREKLARKRVDAIVLNDVSRTDIGFDADCNEVTLITATGAEPLPPLAKSEVAGRVLDLALRLKSVRVAALASHSTT